MTQTMMKSSVIVVLLVMLLSRGNAQSGCSTTLLTLTPCLNYVTGSSATPSQSCCSQLANIVTSNPRCLCSLLNGGGSSLGDSINQTLALSLPDQCKVQTPPISQCNSVAAGPASGPSSATSPVSSPISDEPISPQASPSVSPSPSSGVAVEGPASGPSSANSPVSDDPIPPTSPSYSPSPSERVETGPPSATSPTSDDENQTPNTVSVPPTSSETTSKTVPTTNGSTSGGIMSTVSLSISMLVVFLSALASITIDA